LIDCARIDGIPVRHARIDWTHAQNRAHANQARTRTVRKVDGYEEMQPANARTTALPTEFLAIKLVFGGSLRTNHPQICDFANKSDNIFAVAAKRNLERRRKSNILVPKNAAAPTARCADGSSPTDGWF
jgi:hypothetical protein